MLQSSEGGSFSLGNRKFRVKRSVTPPLTPVSGAPLEGAPVTMPTNLLTERIRPRVRSSRFSTLAAATDKIVISRNVLIGLCLTTFAFGIVTTLAVDHVHARASEAQMPRELDPVVLQTTPIEPEAKRSTATAVASPPPPSALPSAPPSSMPSSMPASVPASAPPLPTASSTAAAAAAVVVQLPPIPARLPPPTPSRSAVHQVAAAAVRTTPPPVTRNRTGAKVKSGSSPSATETAPDEDPVMPAPTNKKWVDPFAQ